MPIRVTCPSCHKRFNVSDRFAGREGPCPNCKTPIKIPEKSEEVVIAVPDDAPKDQAGRSLIKPITRTDTTLSSVQITLIAVGVIGFLLVALILRITTSEDVSNYPWWLNWVAAIAIAPPLVYSAYAFLRNQDLGMFTGSELRNRVVICSVIYAALWLAMPTARIAFLEYGLGSWISAMIAMLAIGAAASKLIFDLEYLMGAVHYGLYLGVCLLGRWIAGIGVLPGMLKSSETAPTPPPAAAQVIDMLDSALTVSQILLSC